MKALHAKPVGSGHVRGLVLKLTLMFLLLTLAGAAQAQFSYVVTNGTATITGYTGSGGAVNIPDAFSGYPVTVIGSSAFLRCTGLSSVTIPGSVTSIGDLAFFGCTNLTNVTIAPSVTAIGNEAFSGCISLTSVAIPPSVTSIGHFAFSGCNSLSAITVDPLNPIYSSVEGVLFDKSRTSLIECPGAKTGTYAIPNSVTSIGVWAFDGCSSLTSISIPNGVTEIPEWAFVVCTSLASVTIHVTVTNIGLAAFIGCTSLSSIVIPDSVITIGWTAFYGCTSLTSVTLGNRVTSIGGGAISHVFPNGAFAGCTSLTSITIPNSVTNIEDGAFSGCTSLTNVRIGSGVTAIGSSAFEGCTNLTSVHFQGNAPSDGGGLFYNAPATIYFLPGTTGWGPEFGGRRTALWVLPAPLILSQGPNFGLRTNGFGFIISWATNRAVVVEACTNLARGPWWPIATNALTDGWSDFTDVHWQDYPARCYRIHSQ